MKEFSEVPCLSCPGSIRPAVSLSNSKPTESSLKKTDRQRRMYGGCTDRRRRLLTPYHHSCTSRSLFKVNGTDCHTHQSSHVNSSYSIYPIRLPSLIPPAASACLPVPSTFMHPLSSSRPSLLSRCLVHETQ